MLTAASTSHAWRRHDEWDPYVPPYDPYGPGASVSDHVGDGFIDD